MLDDQGVPAANVGVLDATNIGGHCLSVLLPDDIGFGMSVDIADHLHFVLHLLLLSQLQLRNLGDVIHLHSGAEHLDLVRVHGSVGDQDLGVLHSLRLVHSNFLVEKET